MNAALVTFCLYTLVVFALAALSNRLLQSKSFLSEYFLGSRGLGVWAFALTFAATSSSGGSFTGFPAKIYTHGWILALWIGSYMVVPICTMGLLGKRLNNVARISGAITVPDVIRDRFGNAKFGLLAVSLIVFFMSFNLVAQFKAGSLILKTLLDDVEMFHSAATMFSGLTSDGAMLSGVDPEYLLCLFAFGIAVIVYTTYGGFHAVVWTDVLQGVVMVFGVILMLPLAINQVGGLESATQKMAQMTPPNYVTMDVSRTDGDGDLTIRSGSWVTQEENGETRLFRVSSLAVLNQGESSVSVDAIEITTPSQRDDLLSGEKAVERLDGVTVANIEVEPYVYGSDSPGTYVTGPGPSRKSSSGFLPLSLSISFFFMWAISGSGQPSNMVRLMAFRDSRTLRRSIFTVAIYYTFIYFPLIVIFCCAKILMPGMESEADRIMPAMAVYLTEGIGAAWLAGLLVAAPFAAVMSTVDSFLLMISSALVRDVYQRNINPDAEERTIKLLSYLFTLLVGSAAMIVAIFPAEFLQDIIVYVGSGLAASFLAPMVYSLYWPRANHQGCIAGMLAGFGSHLSLYVSGIFVNGSFYSPWRPLNFDPIIFGLFTSFFTVWVVTQLFPPPSEEIVRKYFQEPEGTEG